MAPKVYDDIIFNLPWHIERNWNPIKPEIRKKKFIFILNDDNENFNETRNELETWKAAKNEILRKWKFIRNVKTPPRSYINIVKKMSKYI